MTALLQIRDLTVDFETPDGTAHAVRGVSLDVAKGEVLGIVGESGSGKSVTVLSVLGLVRDAEVSGTVTFDGRDLLGMGEDGLRQIRGRRVGVIFQDSLTSLHPMYSIGWQLAQAVTVHTPLPRAKARARAIELLEMVRITDPETRIDDYPHQFSGGMRQRVLIAMALAQNPDLLIADEPTTALDSTTQTEIMELLLRLQRELGMALVLITHDFGVVARLADRIMVMYAGRVVETARRAEVLEDPRHPYTSGLLASIPDPDSVHRVQSIPGQPPSPLRLWSGCAFAERCVFVTDACLDGVPPLDAVAASTDHLAACVRRDDLEERARVPIVEPALRVPAGVIVEPESARAAGPLLVVEHVSKRFRDLRAVDDVTLSVQASSTLGLVGESGSGKSTLARCIAGLIAPSEGRVIFDGQDISALKGRDLREIRKDVQFVFQDPYGSLNPRRRVGSIIGEPLRAHGLAKGNARRAKVQELMELVGLNPEHYNKYPADFSGGQRQRIGIARALTVQPRLLICDEPVSALDVSIQAQVINLLADLQRELSLACVFISHDLSVVQYVSDRTAVMYRGAIVEEADSETLHRDPRHPYTVALLSAGTAAGLKKGAEARHITLRVPPAGAPFPTTGCRFEPRCPRATEICQTKAPALAGPGHGVACHHPMGEEGAS